MSSDIIELLKPLVTPVATLLAIVGTIATGAWQIAKRRMHLELKRERARFGMQQANASLPPGQHYTPIYSNPDDSPHMLTRREFHAFVNWNNARMGEISNLTGRVDRIEDDVTRVKDDISALKDGAEMQRTATQTASETMVRIEAAVESHHAEWKTFGSRAETDRVEMRGWMTSIQRTMTDMLQQMARKG